MINNLQFAFRVSTNLRFGVGESGKLGNELKNIGFSYVAAVVDKGVFEHAQIKRAIKSIQDVGLRVDVIKSDFGEPTYEYLELFRNNFTGKKYDCLIGIGGGSVLDLTKGIAVLLTNEGPAVSFRGFPKLKNRPLPVIAIPTTAGTGSEVTYNAVFTDSKEKKKLGINSTLNFPVRAIIDPLITVNCPKSVTISSGCDALVHALESYVHRNNTAISRIFSKEAFSLIFNALAKVLNDPGNIDIRANLALGAFFAGIALMNAGSGPCGAFSYPLGAVYEVPHGYAGAIFLSSITKLNVDKGYLDYAELHDLIQDVDYSLPAREKNIRFAEHIQTLMDKLGIPHSLSFYKLGPKDIEFLIEQYDSLKLGIAQNPIQITKDDVKKIMYNLA